MHMLMALGDCDLALLIVLPLNGTMLTIVARDVSAGHRLSPNEIHGCRAWMPMFKSLEEGIALAQVLAPMHGVSHTADFFIPGDTEASGMGDAGVEHLSVCWC